MYRIIINVVPTTLNRFSFILYRQPAHVRMMMFRVEMNLQLKVKEKMRISFLRNFIQWPINAILSILSHSTGLFNLASCQGRNMYSLQNMPQTSFTCRDKILGGYYADAETNCQMFHICVKVAGVGVSDCVILFYLHIFSFFLYGVGVELSLLILAAWRVTREWRLYLKRK